ncbi:type VI secretion system amidase immunity protein Tai4 [Neisseriaceae bacterium TC5R-5]|nr:type VI secretion system amidase immunity protein Tai4 [Neisseriaceae bacterium TC5R-5]
MAPCYFDLLAENSTGDIPRLVEKYLARNYPSQQGPQVKLSLLKCLGLYHSEELANLSKRFVNEPEHN